MRILGSKRRAGFIGLVGVVTGFALTAVVSAAVTFGPDRPTFTWAKPATYVTFNSITDNPNYGDERYLLNAGDSAGNFARSMQVKDGQEVVLRAFFHNNAASNLNLLATNTQLRVALPSQAGTTLSPTAYISADNANPKSVFSNVDLTGERSFTLEYVPGSAALNTQYVKNVKVSDTVVTTGALIGTGGADGKVNGCGQFSGFVTIKVRVKMPQPQPQAKFECKALDAVKVDRTRYTFTAQAHVENATVQSYIFTTKNSAGATVDTTTVTTNALTAVYNFNQATAGTYTVSVVVNTDKGSTQTTAVCTKQITVEAAPTPTPTPTPPQVLSEATKSLPDTGAGSVIGLFAGASALGTAAHYAVRRFRG